MQELIFTLLLFIGQNSHMDVAGLETVEVQIVNQQAMADLINRNTFKHPVTADQLDHLLGLFDHNDQSIYLSDKLDLTTAYGRSVLLHELVHYVQFKNYLYAASICHQALEKPAYDLQNDYLVSQGKASRFDKMFIRAAVGWCAEYL